VTITKNVDLIVPHVFWQSNPKRHWRDRTGPETSGYVASSLQRLDRKMGIWQPISRL